MSEQLNSSNLTTQAFAQHGVEGQSCRQHWADVMTLDASLILCPCQDTMHDHVQACVNVACVGIESMSLYYACEHTSLHIRPLSLRRAAITTVDCSEV